MFLDLLTYSDLEALKTRKGRILPATNTKQVNTKRCRAAPPRRSAVSRRRRSCTRATWPAARRSASSRPRSRGESSSRRLHLTRGEGPRRYLILTYCAEFDRVHYPLPLLLDETPNTDAMKQTIMRLRCGAAASDRLPAPACALAPPFPRRCARRALPLTAARVLSRRAELDSARRGSGAGAGGGPDALLADAQAEIRRLQHENAALRRECAELRSAAAGAGPLDDRAATADKDARALRRDRDALAVLLPEGRRFADGPPAPLPPVCPPAWTHALAHCRRGVLSVPSPGAAGGGGGGDGGAGAAAPQAPGAEPAGPGGARAGARAAEGRGEGLAAQSPQPAVGD